jgi:putative ABC transport system ATP-binding protein
MNKSYIECISLSKLYKGKRETIIAVTDINLEVEQNEFVVIKGRSGAGKSTLLCLMCGLVKPTSGRVIIAGQDITAMKNNDLSRLLSEQISIIFQSFSQLQKEKNVTVILATHGSMAEPYADKTVILENGRIKK